MRPKLALKTLYRSPVRTVLTFILLAAVTFALFSQVIEYAIATREMKKAVELYDGALSIQSARAPNSDASNPQYMYADPRVSVDSLPEFYAEGFRRLRSIPISDHVMEQVASLPYISYIDTRYMTAGYSDEYVRLDDGRDYYNYTNQCVIEATVAYKTYERITVRDVELLGGKPKRWFDEEGTFIWAEDTKNFNLLIENSAPIAYQQAVKIAQNEGGHVPDYDEFLKDYRGRQIIYYSWGVERATTIVTEKSKYGAEFFETLETGKRYIFVIRHENYQVDMVNTESYYLTDPFVSEYCDAVIPVDGLPENYLETEEFSDVRAYIDRLNRNMHTFDVVYTQNTGGIRYFADGTIGISEGRGIKREDTEDESNVCVIHHDVAQEYGLTIGDTITISLGDKLFEQYASKGAIDVSPAQVPENLTEVSLEIVGIYKDTRSDDIVTTDPCWSYSVNTIFVPQHLLNVSEEALENHKSVPAEVSFVIDDAWEIISFAEECLPQMKGMKITPFFSDGGWTEMIEGYRETERLALIKLAVLAGSVFVSTCFVAFLYIVGKRRDYAIMRVLGTSKRKSARALLLPLFVMALAAALTGSAAAIIYTQNNIATSDSIEFLSTITQVDTSIPPLAVVGCIAGEIALTLLIAETMLLIIGRNSPLALIQAHTQRQNKREDRKNKRKSEVTVTESPEPVVLGEWTPLEPVKHDGKKRSMRFTLKYIQRHIRRTKGKAVMLMLVTILLLNVCGQLLVMDESYNKLFEETEIISNYAGYLNLNYVNELVNSGYVRDVFYKETSCAEVNGTIVDPVVLTSDIERFAGETMEIDWLDGHNEDSMEKLDEYYIVLGQATMRTLGVELGDTVYVTRLAFNGITEYSRIYDKYYSKHIEAEGPPPSKLLEDKPNPDYTVWMDAFNEKYLDIITEEYQKKADAFTVIGCATSNTHQYDLAVFVNGNINNLDIIYGKLAILDVIEATLVDNWSVEEYRAFGEKLASANKTGEVAFLMDTSKIENVRNNIKLMDTLYPIIVAAILVIGAFLCGLLIVQTSKDIAIMRVLGTSKRRVRAIMIIEHTALCLTGIILASIVLAVRKVSLEVFGQMAIVFALYFGAILAASVIAAIAASRKNVLELLQTKE